MAVKFNLRLCLQLMDQGISLNTISKQYHISKHTSSKVKRRKEELEFDTAKLECYSDTELGKLFFPNLYESEDIYAPIDYEYIHNELSKPGVTLKLLGKNVNIHKVHPHKFRRTLATMAIDKGMPIEQVQKMLGHVKIDTTLHYAMVNQANVKIAHRKFLN